MILYIESQSRTHSLLGIHTFNNNKLNTMNLSQIFFLTKMSNVINKKTNLKSKIKDVNKKKV